MTTKNCIRCCNEKMSRSRNICFTSYDESKPHFSPMMSYLIYQREKCPSTGNPHWQGYVEWVQPMEYKNMDEELRLEKTHYEPRKGTAKQASEYCKKDRSRISVHEEFGRLSNQGHRSDIDAIAQHIGKRKYRDLIDENRGTYVKFHRGFDRLHSIFALSKLREVEVEYIWGPAGVGKSHSVWTPEFLAAYDAGDVHIVADHPEGWMDGYMEQKYIYFEDFEGRFPLRDILRLCDKYPCSSWVKGGRVNMLHTKVVFTANAPPEAHYSAAPEWLRRLSKITKIEGRSPHGG